MIRNINGNQDGSLQSILQKFDRAERNLLLSCFGVALFLSYCLSMDLTFFYSSLSALNGDKELLASIETINNDVLYSPSNLPVWEGGYEDQKLYRKDRLFTETDSEAKVVFYEGTEFIVEQNSLVIIDMVENAPSVNLLRGKIKATVGSSNSSLKILNNGKPIKLLGGGSAVEIEVNGNIERVTSRNGTTLYDTPDGLITLDKGETYSTGDSSPVVMNPPKIGKDGRYLLSWENSEKRELQLLVSRNQDLSSPIVSELTSEDQYWYTPQNEGSYYWRVAPKGQNPDLQTTEKFQVRLRPEALKAVTILTDENGRQMAVSTFNWDDVPDSSDPNYRVQISRNKDFEISETLEKFSKAPTVKATSLRPGTYYWRVKNENGTRKWSDIGTFTVRDDLLAKPVAVLEKPSNLSEKLDSQFATPDSPTQVTAKWSAAQGVKGYELEISKSGSFVGPPVAFEVADSNQLRVGNIKPGQYYWRVRKVLESGEKGSWSSTRDFKVIDRNEYDKALLLSKAKEAPGTLDTVLDSPMVTDNDTTRAVLKWNKVDGAAIAKDLGGLSYEIQVASNADFKTPSLYQSGSNTNNFSVDQLKRGTYYWRIRTVLPDGSRGGWSLVKQFVIRSEKGSAPVAVVGAGTSEPPAPEKTMNIPPVPVPTKVKIKTEKLTLVAPSIVYPANRTIIDIKNQKLEWNKIPEAVGYKLEIFSYKNPKDPILTLEPTENFTKDLNIKPGKYLWRVASISKDSVETFSKKHTFIVKDIDALKSLEALKPDPNDRISTSQVATVVDFEWMEDKNAAYYKIEASLSPKFSTTFFSQRVETNTAKFNFPQGSFYWRLSSYDKEDDLLKQGKINTFSVAATMGTPNFYGDPSLSYNLKKKEMATDVEITWSTVPTADRYDIEIASDEEFTLTQLSNSQIETNISLTLEHGKYFARVRAVDSYGFGSTWSDSKVIEVTSADLEVGPTVLLPKNDAIFVYRKEPSDIAFKWAKAKKAIIYEFQVSKSDSFNSFAINVKSPDRTAIHKLPEGDFYWRVRGVDNNGFTTSWSEVRNFIVKKEGSPVSLTYPVGDKNVVSYGAGNSNFSFKWAAPKDITQFTIVVAEDENFTKIISRQTVKGKKVASLDINHSGPAYWLVEGENIKENFKVRSDTGKFNIVSPSEERWDKSGKVSVGVQPSVGSYNSDGSTIQATAISGTISGRYWFFDSFGLGLSLAAGSESLSLETGEELDFQNTRAAFHLLYRRKLLPTSPYNFDMIGALGLKMGRIPTITANSTDIGKLDVKPESLQYLSLGLGASRILSDDWLLDLGSFYETAMAGSESISSASNIVFLITLQQKVLTNWQLGYGYQYESLSYKLKETDDRVSRPTNALELSIGKGF